MSLESATVCMDVNHFGTGVGQVPRNQNFVWVTQMQIVSQILSEIVLRVCQNM